MNVVRCFMKNKHGYSLFCVFVMNFGLCNEFIDELSMDVV